MFWGHTRNWVFLVKSAYFQAIYAKHSGVVGIVPFLCGLNLPPKFALFLWKIIHYILAVNDGLRRRNIVLDTHCLLCGGDPKTIDHCFLECPIGDCGEFHDWR